MAYQNQRRPVEDQQRDQAFGNAQDDRELAQVGHIAGYLAKLSPEQRAVAYQQVLPKLAPAIQKHGLPAPPPVWDESHLPELEQIAGMFSPEARGASGVQSSFIDAQGNRVAIMRDGSTQILGQNAPNNQIIAGEGGFYGVNKGNLQAAPVMLGQPQAPMPQQAPQAGAGDVMGGLMALGQTPGVTMTSGPRSPAHNAEVGGKPNSQHVAGTAMDYAIPPAMKAQFMALVAKNPDLEAIDEGDHVHVQQRHGAAPGGQLKPAPKPVAAKAPTELERRVQMARQMGASDEQIKAMVVGGGQAGNTNTQKNSQAMNVKKAQLQTVQRQIDRLEQASNAVGQNSVFDGGPLDQYALKFGKQGQELEQASASIMPVLTALTRVPGVGAQSDLESRLAQLQLPSAGMHPEVRAQAIKALREYMADLGAAYENLGAPAKPAAAPAGGWSIQAVP
jgi:hypothetical protein